MEGLSYTTNSGSQNQANQMDAEGRLAVSTAWTWVYVFSQLGKFGDESVACIIRRDWSL